MCDLSSSSLRGFLLRQGLQRGHTPLPGITQRAITSCAYNALHSNNAGDNTNVLIALHPFGIGIALARHQQLQDTIHILW